MMYTYCDKCRRGESFHMLEGKDICLACGTELTQSQAAPARRGWATSRTDMQSYDGNGDPVCFLYPPDESQERIAIRGLDCRATAERLKSWLNGPTPEDRKDGKAGTTDGGRG